MSTNEELKAEIHRLTQAVEEMKARLADLESEGEDGTPVRSTRRRFLTLGAGAAIGALGLAAGKMLPAAAANGDPVLTGGETTGTTATSVKDGSTLPTRLTPVLDAKASDFSQTDLTAALGTNTFAGVLQGLGGNGSTGLSATAVDGVDGWAEGDLAFGVYGLTTSGVGTVGESSTGIGLYSRGSGRILQDPQPAGMPGWAGNDFEIVRDANGVMWISQPGGTWKQVSTTDQGLHVFGHAQRIWDFSKPTAPGTYGPIDATKNLIGQNTGVPVGAQAAWAAVQSYNSGVLTLYPDGTADPGGANWSGVANGPLNLLYMFIPLSAAAKFKMHAYFSGAKYIDIWGYLL